MTALAAAVSALTTDIRRPPVWIVNDDQLTAVIVPRTSWVAPIGTSTVRRGVAEAPAGRASPQASRQVRMAPRGT